MKTFFNKIVELMLNRENGWSNVFPENYEYFKIKEVDIKNQAKGLKKT